MKITDAKYDGINTWSVVYRDLNVGTYHIAVFNNIAGVKDMIIRSGAKIHSHCTDMQSVLEQY